MNPIPSFEELISLPEFPAAAQLEDAKLSALWAATSPELDTEVGALKDLVVRPSAEAAALLRTGIEKIRLNMSLHELAKTGVPADDPLVDSVLANFPAYSRRGSRKARVTIAMIRDSDTIMSIPVGSRFESNGLQYYTEITYTCTPIRVNTDNDRLLTARTDGTWIFTFPAIAAEPGEKYHIKAGTSLQWVGFNNSYVRAYALSDASGGQDPESTAELSMRMDEYMAVPGMAGRMNITSLMRREFPSVLDVSLIGGGDPEMQRDSRNLLSLKTGGRTDMYVRTAKTSVMVREELRGEDDGNNLVRIHIGRDVYPGFYTIKTVRRASAAANEANLQIADTAYSQDLSNLDYDVPLIPRQVDSRYTRFQTADLFVIDPEFDANKPDYIVELVGMPLIGEIQDFVSRRDVRPPNSDILVRAPIPLHVAVNATVKYYPGAQNLDVSKVRDTLLDTVGNRRFRDVGISSLLLGSAVGEMLPDGAEVAPPLEIFGAIDYPDGSYHVLRSTLELTAPTEYSLGVSSRTVAFLPYDAVVDAQLAIGLQV
jgi:hypothetical protein